MFKSRSKEKEIMDDLEGSEEIIQTLQELDVINKRLGGNSVTINALNKVVNEFSAGLKPIKIADLGCGGGDILKDIAIWGRKRKLNLKLIGIDANMHIIDYARKNVNQYPEIYFESTNIFSKEFKEQKFDIIICSLFTHHFSDEELVTLINQLKNQAKYFIINDLHRHPLAYYSIMALTKLFSKSQMVKNDAPISVLRGFAKNDLELILKKAGVDKYTLQWRWAFRWQLILHFN
jgi:2-polyprenyl-3-methyl-5-hydroxy-6-metoxy-1,4-benzoquinol methylase